MNFQQYASSAMGLVARILFPKAHRTMRKSELWYLLVSLAVALVVCVAFGVLLVVLNKNGRQ